MTNRDVFTKDVFFLPKERGDEEFLTFLTSLFNNFLNTIDEFTGELNKLINDKKQSISILCQSILKTVDLYFKGFTVAAYNELKLGINQIKDDLWIERKSKDYESEEFYRARIGGSRLYTREEMFHIPFEMRHLVSTQRYSIPGLPCLYLSNSTYLCWEELGRPEFNKLQFSRFDLKEGEFRFLLLHQTNQAIENVGFSEDGNELNSENGDFLLKYLITWPLQAAVSIITRYKNSPFKAEYIIPQLLLQWVVSTEDVDGIRFFSTCSTSYTDPLFIGSIANIVIPVKSSGKTGLCPNLTKRILLTNPLSWEILSLTYPQITTTKQKDLDIDLDIDNIQNYLSTKPLILSLSEDFHSLYLNTKFGILEDNLKSAKAKHI